MRLRLGTMVLCFVGFLFAELSYALPKFASRIGARCQSCHVNPSGGGMRQVFGVQYGRDVLPVPTWNEDLWLDDFSTNLSDFISVGADMRMLFFSVENPDTGSIPPSESSTNTFWQMQGDIYINVKLARKVSLYFDKGLYSGFEVFGLLNVLPANGHIKVGKFTPNYGTKLDDHTTFIRTMTGFSPERGRPERTGVEVAVSPGPLMISGGVYNATDGFGSSRKALLGRAEGMFKVSDEVTIGIGGNVFTKKGSGDSRSTLYGGMGSISFQNLTFFGEIDLLRMESGGAKTEAIVSYLEVNYPVIAGVDVKFGYDFYDPNRDLKTGTLSRYSIGVEFFPVSGVEVRPVYRIVKEEPMDVKNNEFHLLFHFYL